MLAKEDWLDVFKSIVAAIVFAVAVILLDNKYKDQNLSLSEFWLGLGLAFCALVSTLANKVTLRLLGKVSCSSDSVERIVADLTDQSVSHSFSATSGQTSMRSSMSSPLLRPNSRSTIAIN